MKLVGNIIAFLGAALWIYGYVVAGHTALFDWSSFAPAWVAGFVPNLESEIGLVACVLGSILALTPSQER